MSRYEELRAAADFLRGKIGDSPDVAVVLGSGLGALASSLEEAVVVPYDDIPAWPAARVVGHEGRLAVGRLGGKRVAALAGRVHLYEGHDVQTVVVPIRVMGLLGVSRVILTNAAGGINTAFAQGALMVIDDHVNLTGANPLVGPNDERLGPRFPDMTEVYSSRLRSLTMDAAADQGLSVVRGVYLALLGPSYETPAEIRALRALGADAVGMSTVHEAIAARHMGLEVLGISCITNLAAGVLPTPLDHRDVMETADRVKDQFIRLLTAVIGRM